MEASIRILTYIMERAKPVHTINIKTHRSQTQHVSTTMINIVYLSVTSSHVAQRLVSEGEKYLSPSGDTIISQVVES